MSQTQSSAMLPMERRAAWSLVLIYLVRMLGLFIILPVFSLFAVEYAHSTPFLIGLAIGIYGLLQAALQIPFGMLSDRIGRKKVITIGLLLMALGSAVAAMADSIYWVVFGRALQGAGAISAALMALAADLTRDQQRTKIMAMLGGSIGFSFVLALLLGPLLITWFSIDSLFWFTAICALLGLLVLHTAVPDPQRCQHNADTGADLATVRRLLSHSQLRLLNISIFILHLLITATFVAVPLLLRDSGLLRGEHWQLYLPAMLIALVAMVPLILLAERKNMRLVVLCCVFGLMVTQLVFGWLPSTASWLFVGLTLFFCFLSALEALFPSLVSRLAPAAARGSAMGIYSSSQFFGAFVGGAGGGFLFGEWGHQGLFSAMAVFCGVWLLVLRALQPPKSVTTHRHNLSATEMADQERIMGELRSLPGVIEVVLAIDEQVAYMKVDKTRFQGVRAG